MAIVHAGGACEACGRNVASGAVLQLHHIKYFAGRKPWEYNLSELQVLCKGCHAEVHNKIMAHSNWQGNGEPDDLGDLIGTCDFCGIDFRYVHLLSHDVWGAIGVGTFCADFLTETKDATKARISIERKTRFLKSTRWKNKLDGTTVISQQKLKISVVPNGTKFKLEINSKRGKKEFQSMLAAQEAVFAGIEDGTFVNYFKKFGQ